MVNIYVHIYVHTRTYAHTDAYIFFLHVLFYFFNRSLLEYNCFTILCQFLLHSKVNQPHAYIYPHIPSPLILSPTLPIPLLQVIAKHRADLPVLCCCFPLANYYTFGSVYMFMLPSQLMVFNIKKTVQLKNGWET